MYPVSKDILGAKFAFKEEQVQNGAIFLFRFKYAL
jgi:hypothetical protein